MPDFSSEDLFGIGFVEVGEWTTVEDELSCQLVSDDERIARALRPANTLVMTVNPSW